MAEAGKPCPICGKPAQARFRPFCSTRCANVDLGRWFSEGYAVPAAAPEEDDERNRVDDVDGTG